MRSNTLFGLISRYAIYIDITLRDSTPGIEFLVAHGA
jgi:hypothetical protein